VNASESSLRPREVRSSQRLNSSDNGTRTWDAGSLSGTPPPLRSPKTPSPRGREGTRPGRFSFKRNVVTPLGSRSRSGVRAGRLTAREAQCPRGEMMSQQAKARRRKAPGNRLDRATAHAEKRLTWDRARSQRHPGNVAGENDRGKLDATLPGV